MTLSGEREYTVNGRTFVVGPDTVLLIPAKTKYYTIPKTVCTGIGISFDLYTAAGLLELEPDVYHSWQDHNGQYAVWMKELNMDAITDRQGLLYRKTLLLRILDKMLADPYRDPDLENLLMPALRFIGEHYRENLPVAAYADACHLSESHFRRKFFDFTGMTPISYRDSLRFTEVRRLMETGMTLTKAAELTGFWDASYLRRIYRQRTGKAFLDNKKIDFV